MMSLETSACKKVLVIMLSIVVSARSINEWINFMLKAKIKKICYWHTFRVIWRVFKVSHQKQWFFMHLLERLFIVLMNSVAFLVVDL